MGSWWKRSAQCTYNCNNRNGVDYIERVMNIIDIHVNARMFTQTTEKTTLNDRVCVCARERERHTQGWRDGIWSIVSPCYHRPSFGDIPYQ